MKHIHYVDLLFIKTRILCMTSMLFQWSCVYSNSYNILLMYELFGHSWHIFYIPFFLVGYVLLPIFLIFCFVLPRVKPPTTDCLRIGPTTGRLTRSSDLRSLLRTVLVWPEIRTFAKPGVLRAVSSVVIIRFLRWIRLKCLSWRCDVTRGLPLRGLSFVLPVCRRRIISLKIVILDTLKWPGVFFQPEPYLPLTHGHFNGAVAWRTCENSS